MTGNTPFRNWLLALAATVVAVVICILFIDRPLAEFLDRHVRHTGLWIWVDRVLAPLDLAVLAALLYLLGCGTWVLSGRSLSPWTRTPLLCSWAAMWATAAEIIFKHIFGRGWPDPTYLQEHLYGFHLLHGGPHWESFPSGTAAISSAIAAVLWIMAPTWRLLGVWLVILMSGAVVLNNYHWLGDVVAGAFLGVSIGWMTVHLNSSTWRTD